MNSALLCYCSCAFAIVYYAFFDTLTWKSIILRIICPLASILIIRWEEQNKDGYVFSWAIESTSIILNMLDRPCPLKIYVHFSLLLFIVGRFSMGTLHIDQNQEWLYTFLFQYFYCNISIFFILFSTWKFILPTSEIIQAEFFSGLFYSTIFLIIILAKKNCQEGCLCSWSRLWALPMRPVICSMVNLTIS